VPAISLPLSPRPSRATGLPLGPRVWLGMEAFVSVIVFAAAAGLTSERSQALVAAVSTASLAGLLLSEEQRPRVLLLVGTAVAVTSLAVTLLAGPAGSGDAAVMEGILEAAATSALVAVVTRRARLVAGWVALGLLLIAQMSWVVRFAPDRSFESVAGGTVAWLLTCSVAVAAGLYPRFAAERTRWMVAEARARQRRSIERDLHDYVAHDVTGIIVQAQSARFAAGQDPEKLSAALEYVESAARRAMASLDRSMSLLQDDPDLHEAGSVEHPGLGDIEELVANFRSTVSAEVLLEVRGDLSAVPHLSSNVLYRVVVEGLSNVRQHAPQAREVRLRITSASTEDRVSLINDGVLGQTGVPGVSRGTHGSGLAALAMVVQAAGGTCASGGESDVWRLDVLLPRSASS
jgi:signal transduction histidine kinase